MQRISWRYSFGVTARHHAAVLLKIISRHPTTGIGVPMDRQAALIVPLQCMRVFSMAHHEGLKLAVSHQVSPSRKVKWSLNALKPGDWERPTHCACHPLRPAYITAHPNAYAWVGCACRVYSAAFGFSFSTSSGSMSTLKSRISDSASLIDHFSSYLLFF